MALYWIHYKIYFTCKYRMKTILWILVAIIVIVGGLYWWSSVQGSMAAPAAQTPSTSAGINGSPNQGNLGATSTGAVQQPATAAPIIGANLALGTDKTAKLGTYLIGYTGMTVYTYKPDTGSTSTCYDACASNWPPYIVSSSDNIQQLQAGVTGTVGTTVRTDGSLQLTYNGHPLYFYIGDKTGSDTNGQGLGNVWYVVKP